MPKIAFIGAGSVVFTQRLLGDIFLFPELQDSAIALMDIDKDRLDVIEGVARATVRSHKFPATIEATLDRREALEGADYVFVMIQVGREQGFIPDMEIPLKYGLKQCVGDTLGPGGVFRALRTVPALLDISRDMEELCPDALLINYSNPMAVHCWAISEATSVKNVGLCHSIVNTTDQLAGYLGVPRSELSCYVAGINHMAWFLRLERDGSDLYPVLRQCLNDKKIYDRDRVRFELMRHFGYFVSESSGHVSEYLPYFRRHEGLIEKYCTEGLGGETAFYLRYAKALDGVFDDLAKKLKSNDGKWDLSRSGEYAADIIYAMETGNVRQVHGNVPNTGLITNLPEGCSVEVPCIVDKNGVHPCHVGALPPQLAALNRVAVNVQELAVRAALENDLELTLHAVALDPLTSAVLTLDEMRSMVRELFVAEREFLNQFPENKVERPAGVKALVS